jgi:hypothetical protein
MDFEYGSVAPAEDTSKGRHKAKHARHRVIVTGYPKDSPVLESSYIFPKIEGFGVWHFETSRARAVPEN